MRNPCKGCIYYVKENETCQSKKVATMKEGYITFWDRLFCNPKKEEEGNVNNKRRCTI